MNLHDYCGRILHLRDIMDKSNVLQVLCIAPLHTDAHLYADGLVNALRTTGRVKNARFAATRKCTELDIIMPDKSTLPVMINFSGLGSLHAGQIIQRSGMDFHLIIDTVYDAEAYMAVLTRYRPIEEKS